MIITCPVCETRFRADEADLGPDGRNVGCGKCHCRWRVTADGLPAAAPGVPGDQPAETAAEIVDFPNSAPKPVEAASQLAETAPASPAPHPKQARRRRMAMRGGSRMGPIKLIFALAAMTLIVLVLYLFNVLYDMPSMPMEGGHILE